MVEAQDHTVDQVERLALKNKWFGSATMWTTEWPFLTDSSRVPNCVVLSSDGVVVLEGNPLTIHKQIKQYITQCKKARPKAPDSLPKPLHNAWKNAARGMLGAALVDAGAVAEGADPVLAAVAKGLVAEFRATGKSRLKRVDCAIADGFYGFARERLKILAREFKGSDLAAAVEDRVLRLAGDDLATAIEAERKLQRIEKRLYKIGGTSGSKRQLANFAKKFSGTKAAARAARLAGLIE